MSVNSQFSNYKVQLCSHNNDETKMVNIRFPFPGIPQSAFYSLLTWEEGVGEVFFEQ